MCYDNCLGSANRSPFIVLATEEMQERIVSISTPFQSDPVEGYFKSEYWDGQVYIQITSSWWPLTNTQTPLLITIMFSKTTESFAIHFWHLFHFFEKHQDINSVSNFVKLFPGNTCDMSMAQQNGFYHALDLYTQTEFGVIVNQTTKLTLFR